MKIAFTLFLGLTAAHSQTSTVPPAVAQMTGEQAFAVHAAIEHVHYSSDDLRRCTVVVVTEAERFRVGFVSPPQNPYVAAPPPDPLAVCQEVEIWLDLTGRVVSVSRPE